MSARPPAGQLAEDGGGPGRALVPLTLVCQAAVLRCELVSSCTC